MKMKHIAYFSFFLGISFGCSVLNAPEELIEIDGDGDGDGDSDSGDGDGDVGDGDGDMGGSTGDGDTGDGDGTGGMTGDGDGDMIMPPQPPTTGLAVLAAEDADAQRVLLTIDTQNGDELSREALPVVSVAYDEAPNRFAWFVFTSTRVDPGQNTRANLEVRYYYDDADEWAVLSTTAMLPPPLLRGDQGANPGPTPTSAFRPLVLNGRLAYVSQVVEDGTPTQAVTILNTSDLMNVVEQNTIPVPASEFVVGLVGRRGTALNPGDPGGSVSVMVARNCSTEAEPVCDLVARPVTIGNNVNELAPDNFGPFSGVPAFESTPVLPDNVTRPNPNAIESLGAYALVFNPNANSARWWVFDPANPPDKDLPSSLGNVAASFAGFAVDECGAAGVAADRTGQQLTSVHLATANTLELLPQYGDEAHDVQFDRFSGNLLVASSRGSAAPVLRAFTVTNEATVINMAERPDVVFSSPDDVDIISMALRRPPLPGCN